MNFKDLGGEFPENFDNLILQSARNCPRSFFFRHILHLVPRGVPEMGMKAIFGIALHKGVERLWLGDSIEQASEAAIEEYNSFGIEWGEKLPYTAQGIVMALVSWASQFKDSNKSFDMYAPEAGFLVPMGDFNYYGRIDGVYTKDGKRGAWELKTTKSAYYITENPHNQITGYIYAVRQITQERVTEATLDIIQLQVRKIECTRITTQRSEHNLDYFVAETQFFVSVLQGMFEAGIWPMNTAYCTNWGGCAYKDLCACKSVDTMYRLLPMYDTRQWKPWEEEGVS